MPFVPFHQAFPDIAERETRTFTILDNAELPTGSYALVEMYCDEPGCDCRRVFFSVLSSKTAQAVAVIAYGWESARFYAQWMGDNDPQTVEALRGPSLNLCSPQSALAPAVLHIVKNVVLQDERYVERLKMHYAMFRQVIDTKGNTRRLRNQRKSRTQRMTRAPKRQRRRRRS